MTYFGGEKCVPGYNVMGVCKAALDAIVRYLAFDLGLDFLGMLLIIAGLLVLEHRLVHPADLTHIDLAFFHVNSAISVLLLLAVFLDTWKF
jgi:4-hydroxybenzoate polyprenyltransferase